MKWNDQRVFVSGGAGVIGTALVNLLLEHGASVLVGDLKPMPEAWAGKLAYRQGDLTTMTLQEVTDFAPDTFFHLAATFERSEETYEFWSENFHHNIVLSHHLMSLLKDQPTLKKVIFASSYLVYTPAQYLFPKPQTDANSLKETSPILPRNLCGMAKLQHEEELVFVKKFHPSLQIVSARIFRSYGKHSRDVISRWIRALLKGEPITIFRPEGRFDYIYADDVAQGLLRLADSNYSGVVNLGTGNARPVSDVVAILQKHFPNASLKYEESSIPFEASQADMEHFRKLTNWNGFRKLEEAIPEIIEIETPR